MLNCLLSTSLIKKFNEIKMKGKTKKLIVLEGTVTQVRLLKEVVVAYPLGNRRYIKLKVQNYQIDIAGHRLDATLNMPQVQVGDKLSVFMADKKDHFNSVVLAIKKDQLLYLNPNLHYKSKSILGMANLKTWHWLTGFILGGVIAMAMNILFGFIIAFCWILITAALPALKAYVKFVYGVEEYLDHIILALALPKSVNLFHQGYRHKDQVAVVNLKYLQQ